MLQSLHSHILSSYIVCFFIVMYMHVLQVHYLIAGFALSANAALPFICYIWVKPLQSFSFSHYLFLLATSFISHPSSLITSSSSLYSSLSRCLSHFFKHLPNLDLPNFPSKSVASIYSTFLPLFLLLISVTLSFPFNISHRSISSSTNTSILLSLISPKAQPLMPVATQRKKTHFLSYCHVSEI